MNIQKKLAQLGVVLIVCSGAIVFYLTRDLAFKINDNSRSIFDFTFFDLKKNDQGSSSFNNEQTEVSEPIDLNKIKSIEPESATPALTLIEDKSKRIFLKISSETENLKSLKRVEVSENAKEGPRDALANDLTFSGKHNLISEPISPEEILGKRTTIFLLFSKSTEMNIEEFEEPFGWGNCHNNRTLVHISKSALNFHFGPPNERLDARASVDKLLNKKQLMVLDVLKTDSEIKKVLYLNAAHLGRIVIKDTQAEFPIPYPLILGNSDCKHPFKGIIHKLYVFKDLQDDTLLGISKFMLSNTKK